MHPWALEMEVDRVDRDGKAIQSGQGWEGQTPQP